MKVGLFILLIVVIIGGGYFAVKMRKLPEQASAAGVQQILGEDLELLRLIARESVGADLQNPTPVVDLKFDDMVKRVEAIENPALIGVNLKHAYAPRSNRMVTHLKGTRDTLGGWTMPKERAKLGQPITHRVVNAHGNTLRYEEVVLETAEFDVRLLLALDLGLLLE
jgi:hypothetical protein